MSKHTPGPWSVDSETGFNYVYGWESGRHRVADVGPKRDFSSGSTTCWHNARLIAAAPELLEACESYLEFMKILPQSPLGKLLEGEIIAAGLSVQIDKAIKKAKGES